MRVQKCQNIEEIVMKVEFIFVIVLHLLTKQMFYIFMVGNFQNIFMENDLYLIS